ncbi:GDP-mannose 4,6-dehydratase [Clostridium sp. FP2]|uniref:NAD-dependent epimerase/dehydratase family protein n=1 Tax=Clostridium sp. FP2 TaxID=2724481 RepID=UPI0013E96E34|nr:NAD-dependent epimerase/dehydratase family protein [Clostridium sp. FP2]MBZ9624565.1 GDP-mannose 4,6-dehydratase [Clostridium sp. FP2]
MRKNILVTGSTGFVGACLVEDLVKCKYNVNVIVRKSSNLWRLQKVIDEINIYYADITNKNEMEEVVKKVNPEYIFHLATYGAYYFQENEEIIINTNLIGTKNLVDVCSKVDYKAFVNIGSSSEYGVKLNKMEETNVLEPINVYGVSKAAATLYCNMIHQTQQKPIGTVRLFSVYGKYEDCTRLVPSVILSCLRGENPKLADGTAVRDFIYVQDVLDVLKRLAFEERIGGKIYNLAYGEQHSVKQMVDTILVESKVDLEPIWGSLKGRKSDTKKWQSDMTLLKAELEWEPKYNLEKGIKETIEWFEENIDLYNN